MLLLIYSARKRSDCVFGVLFECPVDLFPFRFFSLTVLFLNSFMLLRVFLCVQALLFVPGWFISLQSGAGYVAK